MNPYGSLEQIKKEAERLKIDILGLAEVRWTNNGRLTKEGWEMIYSGGDQRQGGVGLLVSPKIKKAISEVRPVGDRIITMKLDVKPIPVNIIQVYMPTTSYEDEKVMECYSGLQRVIDGVPKREKLIVMGDFNAKIGENVSHRSCGRFGLGETNERGEILLDWMDSNSLIAANTCFRHRVKERYTWISPNGQYKNMIDYIIVRKRDQKEIVNSRSLVSADYDTDHQMVWACLRSRRWNQKKVKKGRPKRDLETLNKEEARAEFEGRVKEKIGNGRTWTDLQKALEEAIDEICPKKPNANKPWIDNDCWSLIEKRREAKKKGHNQPEHRQLCKEVRKKVRAAKRKWFREQLLEAEAAQQKGDYKTIYKKIKTISRNIGSDTRNRNQE